jgi:putative transcriptional regulator
MKTAKDYERMTPFERIREGLKQSIAQARGELSLRTTTLPRPAPKYSASRVARIRKKAGMSQSVLAAYLNVPKRTLESYEQGRRAPKAGEARLLQLLERDPQSFMSLFANEGGASKPRRKAS